LRIARSTARLAGICALTAGSLGLLGSHVLTASAAGGTYNHSIRMTVDSIYEYNWSASATLYDRNGKEVYHWHESHDRGDYVLWQYYANPGDTLDISFTPFQPQDSTSFKGLNANQDYCYVVSASGAHPYTC
jgi:hypothetical protein